MALTPCNLSNQHTLQYICSKNQLKKLLQTQPDFVFNHTQAKDRHSCEHLMRRAIFSNFLRITPPTGSKGTEAGAGGLSISVPPAAGGRRAIVDGVAELVQHVPEFAQPRPGAGVAALFASASARPRSPEPAHQGPQAAAERHPEGHASGWSGSARWGRGPQARDVAAAGGGRRALRRRAASVAGGSASGGRARHGSTRSRSRWKDDEKKECAMAGEAALQAGRLRGEERKKGNAPQIKRSSDAGTGRNIFVDSVLRFGQALRFSM